MVSTFVGAAVVFSAVLTGDAVVAAVVSRIGIFTSVIAGNVLDSAIVSEFTSFVGLTVECALVLSSIPRGVSVVVTGAVNGFATVVCDSAVTNPCGFVSAVVAGVVVVAKLK